MALMIPNVLEDNHGSYGEKRVFDSLKTLPDEYTVFHSLRWNRRNAKSAIEWGEADFTVLHPEKGMIVFEVKSGGVECRDNRWWYIRTDNNERHKMKNPLEQAGRSKYDFKEEIGELFEDCPEGSPQYCWIEPAVWFPTIRKEDVQGRFPPEYHQEIVLFEPALEDPQKYIDEIYRFYDSRRRTKLDPESVRKIIDWFAPKFNAHPSLYSKRLSQEEIFVRLTREQSILLDYLDEQESAAIQGTAGTGKTMLALKKACRLSQSGKVLFLCFNQHLRDYLKELKNDNPPKYDGVDFCNLPELCCSKLRVPNVEKEDILQFLKNTERYGWDYKHIVVDEGQDFVDEHIGALRDIAILNDGSFYIFFDKHQFVQGMDYYDAEAQQESAYMPKWLKSMECRLVLNRNCRNTYQIAETSGKTIELTPKYKDSSVPGDVPLFHIRETEKEALKAISSSIDRYRNDSKYAYNQICILTMKTENNSLLTGKSKIGNHHISEERDDKGVFFTTARKFKGLESDVIIIVDLDDTSFAEEEDKRLFYVAASRAKSFLDVVFLGDTTQLKTMADRLGKKKYPTPTATIAAALKVKPELR